MAGQTVTAGRLYSHRHCGTESASFAYEPGYLSNPCAYALDPALPLLLGTQQAPLGQSIFGAFSDSCPDRWGRRLIERAERRRAETEGATARSFGHFDPHVDFPEDCCQGSFPARLGPAPGDPVGAGAPARRSSSIACRFSQPW